MASQPPTPRVNRSAGRAHQSLVRVSLWVHRLCRPTIHQPLPASAFSVWMKGTLGQLNTSRWLQRGCIAISVLLTGGTLLPPLRRTDVSQTDLMRFYHAAVLVRSGHTPYDAASLVGAPLAHSLQTGVMPLGYVYPPLLSYLLVPLTYLPPVVAYRLWVLFLAACLSTSIILLCRLLTVRTSWLLFAFALPLAFLLRPVRDELNQGNVDALIFLCLCVGLWYYERKASRKSALFCAIAVAIKPFFVVVLLFFVWKRAYRLCLWTVAWVMGFILIPFIPLGVRGLTDWLTVTGLESGPSFAWIGFNQSPYGVAVRLFTRNPFTVPLLVLPWLPRILMFVAAAGVLYVLTRVIARDDAASQQWTAVEFILVVAGIPLISPLTEPVHLTILAGPLLMMAALALMTRGHTQVALAATTALLFAIFTLPQMYETTLTTGHPAGLQVLLRAVWFYGLLALFATYAYAVTRLAPSSERSGMEHRQPLGSVPAAHTVRSA
jgi:Glycosyltransferase family 87